MEKKTHEKATASLYREQNKKHELCQEKNNQNPNCEESKKRLEITHVRASRFFSCNQEVKCGSTKYNQINFAVDFQFVLLVKSPLCSFLQRHSHGLFHRLVLFFFSCWHGSYSK